MGIILIYINVKIDLNNNPLTDEKYPLLCETDKEPILYICKKCNKYLCYKCEHFHKEKNYEKKIPLIEKEVALKKLKEIKEKIDEQNKKVNTNSSLVSSGLGREIVPSQGLIIACNWVLNQELVNIRLETCQQEEYRYKQPELDLPGGATIGSTKDVAKKTITLYDYSLGVFFGEENILVSPQSRYAFTIIYKTVFLRSRAYNAMSRGIDPLTGHEIRYSAGNCNQNYKERQRKSKYDSGKYKTELDDARETTKYLILANTNGEVTDARYHSYTGIEQQITRDGKAGMEFTQIIEDIKSGNDDSYAYRNAKVYDCRNLYEDGTIEYLVGKK